MSGRSPTTRRCLNPARRSTLRAVAAGRVRVAGPWQLVEAVQARVADEIEAGGVGDDRRVLPVGERPQLGPGPGIERVRRALQRGEVDAARDDGRRARDRPVGLELPQDRARRGVEREESPGVGADEHAVSPDRRRGVHEAAGRLRPAKLAARRAERVDLPVRRPDVHASVGHGGSRVEVARVAEPRLRLRLPEDAARAQAERIDVTRVVADEHAAAGDRDAALHLPVQLGRPVRPPGPLAKRIHASAPVADEHRARDHDRRRFRGLDRPAPQHLAAPDVECDQLTGQARVRLAVARRRVHERLEHDLAVDRRRCRDTAVRDVLPRLLAVLRADREQHARVVGEEQASVRDRRRELDERLRAEHPGAAKRRSERDPVCESLPLGIVAVGRPRDAGPRRRGRRDLGRHELDGRRPFDIAARVLDPEVVRERRSAEHDTRATATPIRTHLIARPRRTDASNRVGEDASHRPIRGRTHRAGSRARRGRLRRRRRGSDARTSRRRRPLRRRRRRRRSARPCAATRGPPRPALGAQ